METLTKSKTFSVLTGASPASLITHSRWGLEAHGYTNTPGGYSLTRTRAPSEKIRNVGSITPLTGSKITTTKRASIEAMMSLLFIKHMG